MTRLVQDWLQAQAECRPEAVGLVAADGQRITYRELEVWSNQLARMLKAIGCKRGDRICFAIPKSPSAIVAILGILKADCVHVPLDPSSPAARVSKILVSSQPRLILGAVAVSHLLNELFASQGLHDEIAVGWMENSPPPTSTFRDRKSVV